MKESITSPYAKLVFRETFNDEQTCRRNGGTPNAVTFSNGVGSFNGTTSYISKRITLNGTYSIRIICNSITWVLNAFLADFRAESGTGYIVHGSGNAIAGSNGTTYINGSAVNVIVAGKNEVVVAGIAISSTLMAIMSRYTFAANFSAGSLELFEIYQGTLTASEVKNLYDADWNKEYNSSSCLLNFDSTQGTIKDRTGKNTLTPTAVAVKKIGQSYSADFNGTTSKIDTGSDFIGTKAVTICGWINSNGAGEHNFNRILDNGKFIVVYRADIKAIVLSSDGVTLPNSSAIKTNIWYSIAITRTSAGIVNFYIGDIKNAPALSGTANSNSGTPAVGITNVFIGNDSVGARTFYGSIPMLQVYEGILDIETITNIWSETRQNFI